jgi:hypothetical protein
MSETNLVQAANEQQAPSKPRIGRRPSSVMLGTSPRAVLTNVPAGVEDVQTPGTGPETISDHLAEPESIWDASPGPVTGGAPTPPAYRQGSAGGKDGDYRLIAPPYALGGGTNSATTRFQYSLAPSLYMCASVCL